MSILAQLVFQRPIIVWADVLPVLILGILMVATLCFELNGDSGQESRPNAQLFTVLGLGGLIVALLSSDNGIVSSTFNDMIANDVLSRGAAVLVSACALLAILAGQEELTRFGNKHGGEFIALILGASVGMILMASANNTIVMFLGLELFSIALYLLCIFFPERSESRESGIKYFLLSSAASSILLYGLALLYGATGSTWISEMQANPEQQMTSGIAVIGVVLVLCGLLFKLAIVPFHAWAPDVYQGAPTTVTAFMSVATKVAALIALWRLFIVAAPAGSESVGVILASLSMVSMVLGNLLAFAQSNVKRMLAYSGVGNAGYLLIAPAVGVGMETPLLFFLATYLVANMGAFLALSEVERILDKDVERQDLRGLYRSHPGLAAAFALSLVSLAGLPPAGGFLAKFLLFGRAIANDQPYLPAIGILCSLLAAGYYLGTAITLYDGRQPGAAVEEVVISDKAVLDVEERPLSGTYVALGLCSIGILVLGIFPTPLLNWLNAGGM